MNLLESSQTRSPNRSSTLARELVHRTALAEVLLTDVQRAPGREHAFRAAAQWARSHPTFDRAGDGRHNPLLVAETLRELGICIPLQFYGVPADSHFLIEELRFAIEPEAEPRARYGGSDITCEVQAEPLQASHDHRPADKHGDPPEHGRHDPADPAVHPNGGDRPGRSTWPERLRLTVRYLAGGREFAHADGIARFLPPAAYAAVRSRRATGTPADRSDPGQARPSMPEPTLVGALRPEDLLIGLDASGRTRLLPADPYHPFFYDHYSDHVPGMVLIEAVRQAAVRQAGEPAWRIVSCALRALCFTEPDPPAEIACTITGPVADFEIRQLGRQTATGTLGFIPGPS